MVPNEESKSTQADVYVPRFLRAAQKINLSAKASKKKKEKLVKEKEKSTMIKCIQCSKCRKSFPNDDTYVEHFKKTFVCTCCGINFPKRSDMVEHMRSIYDKSVYGCPICGKCFVYATRLAAHEKMHRFDTIRQTGILIYKKLK